MSGIKKCGFHALPAPEIYTSEYSKFIFSSQQARDSKFEEVYQMSQFHANPVTQDVLDSVKEDNHILIDWKPTLDLLMKQEYGKSKRCEFAIGIDEFYTEMIALAFPIGNPWIERFNER